MVRLWACQGMEPKHTKVYLPDDVATWVKEEAARQRTTSSALIRALVVTAMNQATREKGG